MDPLVSPANRDDPSHASCCPGHLSARAAGSSSTVLSVAVTWGAEVVVRTARPFEQIECRVDRLIQRLLRISRPAVHRHSRHAHSQCRKQLRAQTLVGSTLSRSAEEVARHEHRAQRRSGRRSPDNHTVRVGREFCRLGDQRFVFAGDIVYPQHPLKLQYTQTCTMCNLKYRPDFAERGAHRSHRPVRSSVRSRVRCRWIPSWVHEVEQRVGRRQALHEHHSRAARGR